MHLPRIVSGLLVLFVAGLPVVAQAQQYFDPGILQKTVEQKPEAFLAEGLTLGSFHFAPSADLVYEYNDNVFYSPDNEQSDSQVLLRPRASLNSDWTRHSLNLSGWMDISRFSDYSSEDYEDWMLRADGRLDVMRDSYASGEVSTMRLHEDRRTPDARSGIRPTEFDYSGYGAGYDHLFNRLKLGAYYRNQNFDYENNEDLAGNVIDNTDRNRDEETLTFRGDYQWMPSRSLYAAYALSDISYDQRLDDNGYARDSDGDHIRAGINFDLTGVLTGDLHAQYATRDYVDPRLGDTGGWNLGAGLTWTPTQLTRVTVRMAGGPQETTQASTSGYDSQLYSIRVQHELKRNWLLHGTLSWTDNDYRINGPVTPGQLTYTEVTRAGLGATWLINRQLHLTGGYTFESQSANIRSTEYDANKLFLALVAEL